MCHDEAACTLPAPTKLHGKARWRHHPDDPHTYYKYGTNYGQTFRLDDRRLRCPFGECPFFKKDVLSYTGRWHFQEWHGMSRAELGGPHSPKRKELVQAARLVTEQESVVLAKQWNTIQENVRWISPFDRDGARRVGSAAVPPAAATNLATAVSTAGGGLSSRTTAVSSVAACDPASSVAAPPFFVDSAAAACAHASIPADDPYPLAPLEAADETAADAADSSVPPSGRRPRQRRRRGLSVPSPNFIPPSCETRYFEDYDPEERQQAYRFNQQQRKEQHHHQRNHPYQRPQQQPQPQPQPQQAIDAEFAALLRAFTHDQEYDGENYTSTSASESQSQLQPQSKPAEKAD